MKKITREEHVAAYWEGRKPEHWESECPIDLFGKSYTLIISVYGDRLEDHRVMMGEFDITRWLSDKEVFEVVRKIGEEWPDVEAP